MPPFRLSLNVKTREGGVRVNVLSGTENKTDQKLLVRQVTLPVSMTVFPHDPNRTNKELMNRIDTIKRCLNPVDPTTRNSGNEQ
ncbi:MAG: hypothetical protein KatS3mg085_756 [Candidatus Dojkabacteria bacterium]|nr:MAG: hypothetical protein KatS3mg085_756 [Candidatus Dojkabacteria bacterium]